MASGDLFISIDDAEAHARTSDTAIAFYLQIAQGIVIDRLERATTDTEVLATIAGWTADTVPAGVKAAILVQFMELYRFRGDDDADVKTTDGRLSDRVERFLGPWLERPFA